jgi:hypothetical protein
MAAHGLLALTIDSNARPWPKVFDLDHEFPASADFE